MEDTRPLAGLGRRRFLAALVGAPFAIRAARAAVPTFARNPFSLGVASGYPRPDGMVLWTRLAPDPLAPGGGVAPDAIIPVGWEVAADEGLSRVVARGTVRATAQFAHAVHVEPAGLAPGRTYWYRFRCGDAVSPIGRTSTAPAPGAAPSRLRVVVGSCQQYEHGYYAAYRHIVADAPDLMLHLGDYIYELSWGSNLVRSHGAPECTTLADYRQRYALYRLDPDLQAAHAACPWLVTWDDHEVDNDYAADLSEARAPAALFRARRAAAYQAYYEHLPLPRSARPRGDHLHLYAGRDVGSLVRILMLDGRQYRTPQPCAPPGRSGGTTAWCADLADPRQSMLGRRQEAWLDRQLARSRATWTVIAQQTVMTRIDEQPGAGERYWTDSWNGYPLARERLLASLARTRAPNPVVLSGDIHAFGAANLRSASPGAPVVASEFITTSLTSQGVASKLAGQTRAENPDLLYGDASQRGYLRLDFSARQLDVAMVGLPSVAARDAPAAVLRAWRVAAGQPGPVPA